MIIKKIIKIKNNKYKIVFDDISVDTYDDVIINNNLLNKKNISNDIYNKILSDTAYYSAYDKSLKYVLKKRRSKKEVLLYLDKNNVSSKFKNKIIDRLESLNLINDIEFCKSYINDKLYLSRIGINKIKTDLLAHEISNDIIENELNNIDNDFFYNRLEKIIVKKINNNRHYSQKYLKQKILNEMINLGYPKDTILQLIDKNMIKNDEIIKNEFYKLYNKLKIKYSEDILRNKLMNKLTLKGFDVDDINNLLNEELKN